MPYGIGERHIAVLHQEAHGAASAPQLETLVYVAAQVDVERRCALRVERAKPHPARTAAPQLHEVFHNIVDPRRVQYRVYRFLRNHGLK